MLNEKIIYNKAFGISCIVMGVSFIGLTLYSEYLRRKVKKFGNEVDGELRDCRSDVDRYTVATINLLNEVDESLNRFAEYLKMFDDTSSK